MDARFGLRINVKHLEQWRRFSYTTKAKCMHCQTTYATRYFCRQTGILIGKPAVVNKVCMSTHHRGKKTKREHTHRYRLCETCLAVLIMESAQ